MTSEDVQWAHAEVAVRRDGNFTLRYFNASDNEVHEREPEGTVTLVSSAGSYGEVLSYLGKMGWELVQFDRGSDSTVYWFKKRR